MTKLNDQEEIFKVEYLKTLKPYDAAIAAGYAESTAKSKAFTWVSESKCPERKLHLFNAIQTGKSERIERAQINADYVLNRLVEIDSLDVLDIFLDDLSSVRPLSEWPKAWRTSISGLDVSELFDYKDGEKELAGLVKKIKWPDKTKNLELIGKHITVQAFKEQVNNTGDVNHNVMLVPSCTDVGDWEAQAKQQQEEILKP